MHGSGDTDGRSPARGQLAGNVHRIAPKIVEEFATANDAADHRAGIDADHEGKPGGLVAVEEPDDPRHFLGELDHASHMVRTVHGQSADCQIGGADGFDFLDAGFLRGVVKGGDEVAEEGERLGITEARAELLQPEDLGKKNSDIGKLAVGPLVALAALRHGGGGKDAVEQFLVFVHLLFELLFLRLDAGRHVVEDPG